MRRVRQAQAARAVVDLRRNAYHCPVCDRYTVTVDVDDGVTPMFLGCRATEGCKGRGVSLCYPLPWPADVPDVPTWEWYRPKPDAFARLIARGGAEADHLEKGGLMIRRRRKLRL